MNTNLLLMTDSYKASHYLQYPAGTTRVSSYIEARGGQWPATVFFGLQMFIREYLSKPITLSDIDEAQAIWEAHGEPFNRDGWFHILQTHSGYLPVRIEAAPEGSVIPVGNVLVQIVNTDPMVPWLTSFLETALLRAVWYPTTVATNSYEAKKVIFKYLQETSDDPLAELPFKMHDFGARGVSSAESAALGGAAHLVNFMGTDTIEGVLAARRYYYDLLSKKYGADMPGFSIPAAEHSTITSWGGPEYESQAFENMLNQFAKPGKLVAVVSDSYDIYNATSNIWGSELLEKVKNSGATVVVRPDSGDPTIVPIEVIELLMEKVGYTINRLGYKVLPSYFRVIQGDGINVESIRTILQTMKAAGLSASNIAFGQGGGLLQQVNRDTQKFAMKCSAIEVNGVWRDVWKDPISDSGKQSKRGRLALIESTGIGGGVWRTILETEVSSHIPTTLRTVFDTGIISNITSFESVRALASKEFSVREDT
jgi:nicotinamide phosphoribosyltransferase